MPAQSRPLTYQSGDWEIDLTARELRARGSVVPIGARTFEIIEVLVQSAGALVTKEELMDRVWPGAIVLENTLQVHISAVRKALGANRRLLKTESGRGYRLLGDWSIGRQGAVAEPVRFTPAPPSEVAAGTNLPAATMALIGRADVARKLHDFLSAYRVVTLTGPGGIGKTALALDVARGVLGDFDGGGWLVELAPLADPALVPSAVSRTLGLNLAGDAVSPEAIARAIGDRKLLLVLDNCEHVIDTAAQLVETIMHACPRVVMLVTSREVLRIDGEYAFRVPPLDIPLSDTAETPGLLEHSAVELFVARARAANVDFSLQGEFLSAIAAICRHLDGIPLAIEFAAARAATLGLAEVAAHLDDRFRFLTSGRRTALPRHQTLRAVLDWSYELLPEAERVLLRNLAVFAGDFSLDGAIAVAGSSAANGVVDDLTNLVAKSLVVPDLHGELALYRLLETTRVYALEKLRADGALREVARRHAEYYREFFAPAEAESETRPPADWLAHYGGHIDNVRAALDWAFATEGDLQTGVALTAAAVPLWVQLSLLGECRERVERALATLDGTDEPATAVARMQLSAALGWTLMYGVGRTREAGPAWRTTLALAERLDDTGYQMRALWGLCIDQINNGEFTAALAYARRFAAAAARSADPIDQMLGDRILATTLHYLGDQNSARHHIDRVITQLGALTRQAQIIRLRFDHRVSAHYFQARILWLQGAADQARRVVELNIEEGLAIGHALTFCSVLGQAACPITFLAGDLDAAARYGAMLLDHTERHPVRLWRLWARCFIGMVTIKRGGIAPGLDMLRGALDEAGDARFLPRFLLPLGELAACLGDSGDAAEALTIVDETLARCEARDERWYVAELLRIKGQVLLATAESERVPQAEACFDEALAVAGQQGALFWELRAAASLARLRMAQNRREGARELLAPVYARFTEGFSIADLRNAKPLLDAL